MNIFRTLLILVSLSTLTGGVFIYSGLYDIGADAPHSEPVFWLLETARDQSIKSHARNLKVPRLDDPALIAEGAEHYSAMCAGCHLAPGMAETEIRKGLYPVPPKLADPWPSNPAEEFWVIKHGVKSTAMPAWGATHSDAEIWSLVAFVDQLQSMSPQEYEQLTAASHSHHHHAD